MLRFFKLHLHVVTFYTLGNMFINSLEMGTAVFFIYSANVILGTGIRGFDAFGFGVLSHMG